MADPQKTVAELRKEAQKLEDEQLMRQRETNKRLRQEAVDAAQARKNTPPQAKAEPTPEKVISTPTPETSEEEEYKKNRPTYLKK